MKKIYSLVAGLLFSVIAYGATFNLFTPANGVLKGDASTYVTTPATSTDVKSLWSGTCDSTTYLRGDGSCQTPPGTGGGTVNSVALSAPSVFSVSGSPVTTSGTLGLTFATGQTANRVLASPDSVTGAITLRSLVAGDLPTVPVTKGGSGVTTLTGLVKGNGTSAFTSALAADVYGLWSGTCNSTSFLRGDGACASPGTGTVTSVALTVPSGFSVTGSPVTTSGTLAISGTLNPAAGGTGVATLTGIAKGNGTSAFTAAVSGDVRGLWGGTCDATTYLRGDGSCATPASGGTAANPSASVGLSAVNGSAITYMRSDAAPVLSQSIAPTWTGSHTFTTPTTFNSNIVQTYSVNGSVTNTITNSNTGTAANAYLSIQDGTNSLYFGARGLNNTSSVFGASASGGDAYIGTGTAKKVIFGTNNLARFSIGSAGELLIGTALSSGTSGQVLTSNGSGAAPSWQSGATSSSGTFAITWSGFSSAPSGTTGYYSIVGGQVCINIPSTTGTSNAATMSLTGLPAAAYNGAVTHGGTYVSQDNGGSATISRLVVNAASCGNNGCIAFNNGANGSFTSSGVKGLFDSVDFCYYNR